MTLVSIGLESSADKLGVGIVDSDGKILYNKVRTYKPEIGKGVIPRDAAEHHAANRAELAPVVLIAPALGKTRQVFTDVRLENHVKTRIFKTFVDLVIDLGHRFIDTEDKYTGVCIYL